MTLQICFFSKGWPMKPEPTKSASPVQAGVEDGRIHVEYRYRKRKSKFWEVLFERLAQQRLIFHSREDNKIKLFHKKFIFSKLKH